MKIMANYNNPYLSQQKRQTFGLNISPFKHIFRGLFNGESLTSHIGNYSKENTKPLINLLTANGINPKWCTVEQADLNFELWLPISLNGGNEPPIIRMLVGSACTKKKVKKIPEGTF